MKTNYGINFVLQLIMKMFWNSVSSRESPADGIKILKIFLKFSYEIDQNYTLITSYR